MRCAACPGDDDVEAFALGILGKSDHAIRRAVRGDDPRLMLDLKLVEDLARTLHGRPVGLAAHYDGYLCAHQESFR